MKEADNNPTIDLVTRQVISFAPCEPVICSPNWGCEPRVGPCQPQCNPNCQPACVPSHIPDKCMPEYTRPCIPALREPPKPPRH